MHSAVYAGHVGINTTLAQLDMTLAAVPRLSWWHKMREDVAHFITYCYYHDGCQRNKVGGKAAGLLLRLLESHDR